MKDDILGCGLKGTNTDTQSCFGAHVVHPVNLRDHHRKEKHQVSHHHPRLLYTLHNTEGCIMRPMACSMSVTTGAVWFMNVLIRDKHLLSLHDCTCLLNSYKQKLLSLRAVQCVKVEPAQLIRADRYVCSHNVSAPDHLAIPVPVKIEINVLLQSDDRTPQQHHAQTL